jgi:hypothetical protein
MLGWVLAVRRECGCVRRVRSSGGEVAGSTTSRLGMVSAGHRAGSDEPDVHARGRDARRVEVRPELVRSAIGRCGRLSSSATSVGGALTKMKEQAVLNVSRQASALKHPNRPHNLSQGVRWFIPIASLAPYRNPRTGTAAASSMLFNAVA